MALNVWDCGGLWPRNDIVGLPRLPAIALQRGHTLRARNDISMIQKIIRFHAFLDMIYPFRQSQTWH